MKTHLWIYITLNYIYGSVIDKGCMSKSEEIRSRKGSYLENKDQVKAKNSYAKTSHVKNQIDFNKIFCQIPSNRVIDEF